MSVTNRQIRLAARPVGEPAPSDWEHTTEEVGEPGEGELRVEVLYLSLDPAMRGWMNDVRSYMPPVGLGEVMRAIGIGRVTASAHPDFAVGDVVEGQFGVQEHALSGGEGVRKIDAAAGDLPTHLGALGMPGFTAYFGLLDTGKPKPGDTVVVSGAAGAVGSVVGQIAKGLGCHVVGIAGGPEKCAWLVDELGFDAAIDYKAERVGKALRTLAPDGVDVYFDNVGGEILDDVLGRLSLGARVVICGAISQYNATALAPGPAKYLSLLVNRASMTGMLVFDYVDRYPEAVEALSGWIADGTIVTREQVVGGGIDAFPETFLGLFRGENTGKLVLQVAAP